MAYFIHMAGDAMPGEDKGGSGEDKGKGKGK